MPGIPGFIRKLRRRFSSVALAAFRKRLLREVVGGESLHLESQICVIRPDKLILGRCVHIGANGYINCVGGVTIGDSTIISRDVTIYSYDHDFKAPTMLPFGPEKISRPVRIGRYVWIGMNVTVAPGTVIGDGAVIGMGMVVSGTIPENAIVVSAKPRIVGFRDADQTRALVEQGRLYSPTQGAESVV